MKILNQKTHIVFSVISGVIVGVGTFFATFIAMLIVAMLVTNPIVLSLLQSAIYISGALFSFTKLFARMTAWVHKKLDSLWYWLKYRTRDNVHYAQFVS